MLVDYREHRPDAPLNAFVARMAYGHFTGPIQPEQLAPDSYIKLALIIEGEPLYFNGSGERMEWHDGFCGHVPPEQGIITYNTEPIRCLMANFYPSGFHRLFGLDVTLFNGRMIRPGEVLGGRAERLYEALRNTNDPLRMFELVEGTILEHVQRLSSMGSSIIQVLESHIRERKGLVPVSELARIAGMSERSLQRRFKKEIGLGPKEFCSVVRFNHVYSHMQRTRKLDLDIALQCGYFDESHMLKDLRYYLGKAPKRFADMIRPMVDASLGQ